MVPPGAVKDTALELLDAADVFGAVGHIAEPDRCDQGPRVPGIGFSGLAVDEGDAPMELILEPTRRDAFLLQMDMVGAVEGEDHPLDI